jgi:2-polyprenyl-6-methoxyphenol hydroxylase-like FAD-dependent oxidoreductase
MKKTVLISGAGVAGLTLAYWLNRYGYHVTVVEISPGPKKGGAAIDVRGEALGVAERIGVLNKIKDAKIKTSVEFVNAQNECIAAMKDFGADAEGQDIELNRNDLIDFIYGVAGKDVEYLFNNRIQSIAQNTNTVSVTFKDGVSRNFDFVFGADGVHSTVRKFVFGDEQLFNQFFGAYFAILITNENAEKQNTGRMYNVPNKMAATNGKGNSILVFRSPKLNFDYRNDVDFKQILKENFAGEGWKIPGILTDMINSSNLYFDEICQIKMPGWTKGRVALIGDAAYCAGFPTGIGTSLAMQGATLLADELMASQDYNLAFSKYYSEFHPFVETVQASIDGGINFLVPQTEEEIKLRNEMVGT